MAEIPENNTQQNMQMVTQRLLEQNKATSRLNQEHLLATHLTGIQTVDAVDRVKDETVKTNSLFSDYFERLKSKEGIEQERARELSDAIKKIGSTNVEKKKEEKKEEEKGFLGKKSIFFRFGAFLGGIFAFANIKTIGKALKNSFVKYFKGQFKILKFTIFKPLGKLGRALGFGGIMDSFKNFTNGAKNTFKTMGAGLKSSLLKPFKGIGDALKGANKNADAIQKSFNKTAKMTANNTKVVKGPLAKLGFGKAKKVSTAVTNVNQMKAFKDAGPLTKGIVKGRQFLDGIKSAVPKKVPKPGLIMKFFKFFGKMLRGVPVLGQILTILDGVIGSFKGFFAFKDEGLLMGIFGASTGFIRGIMVGFLGFFGDLLKNGLSFILRKIGLGFISDFLDKFSFTDMINNFFDKMMDTMGTFIMNIKDAFKNGFVKGVAILALKLDNMIGNIIKFPKALLFGGLSALGAILPGGKTPQQAFKDGFNKSMAVSGAQAAMTDAKIRALGGKDAEGIKAEREALRAMNKKKREDRKAEKAAEKEAKRLAKIEKQEREAKERLRRQNQTTGQNLNNQGQGAGSGNNAFVDASTNTGGSTINNNNVTNNNYYGGSGGVSATNGGGYAGSAYGLG